MRRKIYLSVTLLALALNAICQFVPKPMNFPDTGYYYPYAISIVDHTHCWFGTQRSPSLPDILPYPFAIHTNNGGETFVFDSIPIGGTPYILDLSAVDSSLCYYVMTDSEIVFSIWKTADGGTSWQKKTTTQFEGGYLDFYHAFSADTGVAVGDPTSGYFEIQITNDGGNTWMRVPSANIPGSLGGEYAWPTYHCAIGNTIWFSTNKGRCFKSVNKGLNWTVVAVMPPSNPADVEFASPDNGVFYPIMTGNIIYKSTNGGASWIKDTIPVNDVLLIISAVPGFNEGFIFTTTPDNVTVDVYFTPDFFHSTLLIQSGIEAFRTISFKDATTGWLTGSGNPTNDIYYYTEVLTSVSGAVKTPENLSIMPNPTVNEALVKLPGSLNSKPLELRICDITGREIERRFIASSTGWTNLSASGYVNGMYLVGIFSGDHRVACQRWIVCH
jgi:hypothetical protein